MVNIMEGNVALLTFLTSFIQFKERCLMSKQTRLFILFIYLPHTIKYIINKHNKDYNK